LPDDTPISYSNALSHPVDISLMKKLFYAHVFCLEILERHKVFQTLISDIPEHKIFDYMMEKYVNNIPGHPNSKIQ
jgi:hypothetical protein